MPGNFFEIAVKRGLIHDSDQPLSNFARRHIRHPECRRFSLLEAGFFM